MLPTIGYKSVDRMERVNSPAEEAKTLLQESNATMDVSIILSVLCLAAAVMTASSASLPCKYPNATQLHAQWADYITSQSRNAPESYFSVPMYAASIAADLAAGSMHDAEEIYLSGDQDSSHCALSHIEGAGAAGSVGERAHCPWYHIISHSPDRYPADVAEARCRCQYGAGMGAGSACEQVHYNIRVLRRTDNCVNGYYVYAEGWQSISVGCTATRAL